MLLRIFLFGLIAIARSDHHATIMVLNADLHDAYIAFGAATCPTCGQTPLPYSQPLPLRYVRGYDLEGYDLIFSATPLRTGLKYSQGPPAGGGVRVPNAGNVSDFSWTVSMPDVLKVSSRVTKCIQDGRTPPCNLAALLALDNATFRACHIVTNAGEQCRGAAMYPYTFGNAGTWEQSMASAVEVDVALPAPEATGKGLLLTLRKFHHGTPSEIIPLVPTPCKAAKEGCIDVFINSVSRADYDIKNTSQAMHFGEFYRLLDDRANYAPVVPQVDDLAGCYSGGQPACLEDIPPLLSTAREGSKRNGMLRVVVADNTQNKPICPLVQVNE